MGIFSTVRDLIVRQPEPVVVREAPSFPEATRRFNAPMRVWGASARDVKRPMAEHSWTYAAVTAKLTSLTSVPFYVYKGTERVADTDPIQVLFDRPSPSMGGFDLFYATFTDIELSGEAFWLLISEVDGGYNPTSAVREIWPLVPARMKEVIEKGVLVGWEYNVGETKPVLFDFNRIVHFKLYNPYNRARGLAPLAAANLAIQVDSKIGQVNDSLMDNGCEPGGILVTDDTLDDKFVEAIRSKWADRHKGSRNRGNVAVLHGGLKYVPTNVSAAEMEFPATREWSREEVLAVFGVPKLLVGLIDDVNRSTARETLRLFWQNTVIPRLHLVERTLWTHVFLKGKTGHYGKFDLSAVDALNAEFTERLDQAAKMLALGLPLFEINERLELGLDIEEPDEQDPTIPGAAASAGTGAVQDLALNGAQVTAMLDILGRVQDGTLPKESAIAALLIAFPTIKEDEARKLVNPIKVKTPSPSENANETEGADAKDKEGSKGVSNDDGWWAQYDRAYTNPGENLILAAVRSYYAEVAAETLKLVPRAWSTRAALTEADVSKLLLPPEQYARIMRSKAKGALARATTIALKRLASELGGRTLPKPEDRRFLVAQANRVAQLVRVSARDRERMRAKILQALGKEGGATVADLTKVISSHFKQAYSGQALTIARTETAMLGNAVRFQGMKSVGIKKHKWTTARDAHVRPALGSDPSPGAANHRKLHGQTRKIGDAFSNGLLYPGEPGGKADEVVNCRCAAIAVTE